ncbi:MAG: hypothetical protein DIU56_014855 [Pseudomonadota bacterium]|jgi:hypothetical protein|nr:MAG: hypothetical protein DIU56_16650 [Pseudomonadota bacterium]
MKKWRSAAALVIALSGITAGPAFAQERDLETARQALTERLEYARERLQLTDEQAPQVEAILRKSAEKRRAVLEKYRIGESRLSPRQARTLKGELEAIRKDTRAALAKVLTPQQLEEYDRIQSELRAEVRAAARQRHF